MTLMELVKQLAELQSQSDFDMPVYVCIGDKLVPVQNVRAKRLEANAFEPIAVFVTTR